MLTKYIYLRNKRNNISNLFEAFIMKQLELIHLDERLHYNSANGALLFIVMKKKGISKPWKHNHMSNAIHKIKSGPQNNTNKFKCLNVETKWKHKFSLHKLQT